VEGKDTGGSTAPLPQERSAPPDRSRLLRHALWAGAGWTLLLGASLAVAELSELPVRRAAELSPTGGPALALLLRHRSVTVLGHAAVWALGLCALALFARRLHASIRAGEAAALQRAQLEREVLRAGKLEALGRLSGGIAHDFNNLLTPILGHAQLALSETPDTPETAALREDLRQIQYAAERARDLTLRLLAFGREEKEQLEPVDLGRLVAGVEGLLRRLLGEEVEIRVTLDPVAPLARADRAQLELALMGLGANAHDAMPDGGVLRVATGARHLGPVAAAAAGVEPGDYALLEVSHDGNLDEQTRSRLLDPAGAQRDAPVGLGLVALTASVRRAGGAVETESAPGRGTTFRLVLPAASDRDLDESGPVRQGSEQVLVVEDDIAVLHFTSAVLSSLGYRVRAVGHPEEAMTAGAGPQRYDLLLTDVMMPAMRGTELWKRFSRLQPNARVLFISGHAMGLREAGGPQGTVLLAKPFTPAQLGKAVRRALEGPASSRTPPPWNPGG
jgi:signal transduction histidine kinase